jgi:hypothetical protein
MHAKGQRLRAEVLPASLPGERWLRALRVLVHRRQGPYVSAASALLHSPVGQRRAELVGRSRDPGGRCPRRSCQERPMTPSLELFSIPARRSSGRSGGPSRPAPSAASCSRPGEGPARRPPGARGPGPAAHPGRRRNPAVLAMPPGRAGDSSAGAQRCRVLRIVRTSRANSPPGASFR